MALWKKLTVGLFSVITLLLVAVIVGVVLLGQFTSDMCVDNLISETPSPNGQLKAVLFQINCGATTGFNSHVAIMPSKSLLSKTHRYFGNRSFFAADTNRGKAPTGKGGGPEVQLRWVSDANLELESPRKSASYSSRKHIKWGPYWLPYIPLA